MRTTQGLAINGDGPFDRAADLLHPMHETGLKLLGMDEGEDPPKCIMRRNAIRQIEQLRKKGGFGFAKLFDLYLVQVPETCCVRTENLRK